MASRADSPRSTHPWGNDQDLSGANTARVGLKMTVPIDLHTANVAPDGCRDMVGNVWEMTHSPAPGGGVVVRGGIEPVGVGQELACDLSRLGAKEPRPAEEVHLCVASAQDGEHPAWTRPRGQLRP